MQQTSGFVNNKPCNLKHTKQTSVLSCKVCCLFYVLQEFKLLKGFGFFLFSFKPCSFIIYCFFFSSFPFVLLLFVSPSFLCLLFLSSSVIISCFFGFTLVLHFMSCCLILLLHHALLLHHVLLFCCILLLDVVVFSCCFASSYCFTLLCYFTLWCALLFFTSPYSFMRLIHLSRLIALLHATPCYFPLCPIASPHLATSYNWPHCDASSFALLFLLARPLPCAFKVPIVTPSHCFILLFHLTFRLVACPMLTGTI